MSIDFSLFKNIDFTSRDNLLFAGIIFVTVAVVFIVFIIIIKKILNFIRNLFKEIFSKRIKKSKVAQASQNVQQASIAPTAKIISKEQLGNIGGMPSGNDFKVASVTPIKKAIEEKKETQQSYKEEEAADISESLRKLQADQDMGEDTVASKMPSRGPEIESPGSAPIKINRPEKFVVEVGKKDIPSVQPVRPDIKKLPSKNVSKNDDGTIFGGATEVSRRKLEHEARVSSKVWQASKAVGLKLSPIERSQLIKEVFSPEYGVNISKRDVQTSLRKLNRKMVNATNDSKTHEKLRKEIKFIKKIGGIK